MKQKQRTKALWIAASAALAIAAIVIPLLVFAGSEQTTFTATLYSDVIRFEADGVASLRVTIYDLSENELWSSGQVMGDFVDWDRTNERGERLANGYYMYLAQGWDTGNRLVLNKAGKVVLLPGDQVHLQASRALFNQAVSNSSPSVSPLAVYDNENLVVNNGGLYYQLNGMTKYMMGISGVGGFQFMDLVGGQKFYIVKSNGVAMASFDFDTGALGIGVHSPSATMEIHGSATNLLALYDSAAPADPKFRVTTTGDVYADGTVYSYDTAFGGADVAERINVSEWVEAGDVIEIDPDHAGFFRKASGAYSRRVAGIISTTPGVILGNDFDPKTDKWDDNRPVLAIAGRVPVKASTKNGPIAVGDLLVSSSVPGVAMKGDPTVSIGAVVGKAMEAFESGEGVIMAQVALR